MKRITRLMLFVVLVSGLTSCRYLNPSIMLKTDKVAHCEQCDTLNIDSLRRLSADQREYRISNSDIIEFRLFANDGNKLVDMLSVNNRETQNLLQNSNNITYNVDNAGKIRLPILDSLFTISGLTVPQAEAALQKKYAKYYIDPFVMIRIINKRVLVFPGSPGDAKVVPLTNNHTTVLEALAQAGGIAQQGKAWNIKLVRTVNGKTKAYHMDLSTIRGIDYGNVVLQANDIIYVEQRRYYTREVLSEITPLVSLISSAVVLVALFTRN